MRKNKKEMGFTLVELVFVVAIILVLAGIFLPIGLGQLEIADDARANADTQAIATGLSAFFGDLRHFPTCSDDTDCNKIDDAANNLRFLAFGEDTGDLGTEYPADATTLDEVSDWDLLTEEDDLAARNNAYNHLVTNDPNADGASDQPTTDYKTGDKGKTWEGPYMAKVGLDPFGQTYIAHVGAMEEDGCPVTSTGTPPVCTSPTSGTEGWILSAGPNTELETATTSTTLGGDDIGFIFVSR